jgi:hypothetical protein
MANIFKVMLAYYVLISATSVIKMNAYHALKDFKYLKEYVLLLGILKNNKMKMIRKVKKKRKIKESKKKMKKDNKKK